LVFFDCDQLSCHVPMHIGPPFGAAFIQPYVKGPRPNSLLTIVIRRDLIPNPND
jgi:hypothetical protein